ncbi:hypothetical protein ACP6JB_007898 [Aspergillus fumigatus]
MVPNLADQLHLFLLPGGMVSFNCFSPSLRLVADVQCSLRLGRLRTGRPDSCCQRDSSPARGNSCYGFVHRRTNLRPCRTSSVLADRRMDLLLILGKSIMLQPYEPVPPAMTNTDSVDTANGAFVIAAGAILGVGASFLWVAQGAIMTTYVPESQKGRAIAAFWIIFNLGGGVGSLASFGLNYHSHSGTVTDGTYIALLIIMAIGWLLGSLICPPASVRVQGLQPTAETEKNWRRTAQLTAQTMTDWRVLCMIPMFFCANVFYSYQQNIVNGMTFNIRTRSLNGSLYWIAQMLGGLVIGLILDMPRVNRQNRARVGWLFLFATGMAIWGGGYAFQKWYDRRMAQGHKQDIDYTQSGLSTGPIFLYIFYGAYDAFWQGFCYWLMGARSNSPAVAAILVGAYKTFQATGGAMAWRLNALAKPAMTQFAMDWGLCMGALVVAIPSVLAVTLTSEVHEEVRQTKDGEE